MGGCFVFVMGAVFAVGLAAALAGLFGLGCVIAAIALGIVFVRLRKKRAAEGKSFEWILVVAIVLLAVGVPLFGFAFWLFFVPA
ncbi:MAG: hypothetical protein Q4B35_06770 [Slackia sp.]|nr:hypothetical protein [Slackia sp.]